MRMTVLLVYICSSSGSIVFMSFLHSYYYFFYFFFKHLTSIPSIRDARLNRDYVYTFNEYLQVKWYMRSVNWDTVDLDLCVLRVVHLHVPPSSFMVVVNQPSCRVHLSLSPQRTITLPGHRM